MKAVSPILRKRLVRSLILLGVATLMAIFEISPVGILVGLDSIASPALAAKDRSDVNGDGLVDLDDLKLFSQEQLGVDWTTVDWCQWMVDNPKAESHYSLLFDLIRQYFYCGATVPILSDPTVSGINIPNATMGATIVNDGGFPVTERGTLWNTTGPPVTEHKLAEGGTAVGTFSHVRTDLTGLPIGVRVYFRGYAVNAVGTGYTTSASFVVPNPLTVKHKIDAPVRLALGPYGYLYVSDRKVKSVFIYDSNLQLTGELKDLPDPIGVAVDFAGFIYVGNAGIGNVEKYDSQGKLVATIGQNLIRGPTDLALDWDNNLYVADGLSDVVWVFRPDGSLLRTLRSDGLKFPNGVEVAYYDDGTGQIIGELFVADKGNYLVKVFDLQGNLLRSFGGFPAKSGWFNPTWDYQGKFISLQSLAVDGQGYLHALDNNINKVQILDPVSGAYIGEYGDFGTGPGQFRIPLDIVINKSGQVIVADCGNKRVKVIYTIP